MTTRYTVTYAPRARRDLRKLPEKIATACVEFIRTVVADDPYRVASRSPHHGKELFGPPFRVADHLPHR